MTYGKKLGYFYLIFYLVMWPYKYFRYGFADTLWYCDTALLVLAILLIREDTKLLSLVFPITLAMQLPWIVDMIFILVGLPTIGLSSYMFSGGHSLTDFMLSLRHIFMVPLTFIYFKEHKYYANFKHLFYTYFVLFNLTVMSAFFLADPETNMNCSRSSCVSFLPSFENPFLYLPVFLVLGFFCTHILNLVFIKALPYLKKLTAKSIIIITIVILALLIVKHQSIEPYECLINSDMYAHCYYFDIDERTIFLHIENPQTTCTQIDTIDDTFYVRTEPGKSKNAEVYVRNAEDLIFKLNITQC